MDPKTTNPPFDQDLVDMLLECRKQFQFYADQHMAKNPPQVAKAHANVTFVSQINNTLLQRSQRLEG